MQFPASQSDASLRLDQDLNKAFHAAGYKKWHSNLQPVRTVCRQLARRITEGLSLRGAGAVWLRTQDIPICVWGLKSTPMVAE